MNMRAVERELGLVYDELSRGADIAESQGDRASARRLRELADDLMARFDERLEWVDRFIGQPSLSKYLR